MYANQQTADLLAVKQTELASKNKTKVPQRVRVRMCDRGHDVSIHNDVSV